MQQLLKPYTLFFMSSLFYLLVVSFIDFPLTTLLKPIPILCLMAVASCSSLPSRQKKWLLTALLFSILGDIALTLPVSKQLELGLGFFLLAHILYIILFTRMMALKRSFGLRTAVAKILYPVVLVFSGCMVYILVPHLGAKIVPVSVYMLIITSMALCAIPLNLFVASGALVFMISDSLIAFSEFMYRDFNAVIWIMLTYYLAQFLIVLGIIRFFQCKSVGKKSSAWVST